MELTNYHPETRTISGFKIFSALTAALAILGSLLTLIGWGFNFSSLKGLNFGTETTKPLGAIGVLTASLALFLLQQEKSSGKSWQRMLGLACAGLTFLIGGAVLLEYTLGVDFGIDRLLFWDAVLAEGGPFPGRPAFLISVCLTILGLALMAIHSRVRGLDFFVFAVFVVGLVVLTDYAFGLTDLSHLYPYRMVPLPSALLLVFLSLGFLAARPESSFMSPLTSPLAGGVFARRFLPGAILLPLLLEWLQLFGQSIGLYSNELGRVFFSTSSMLVFIGLVYWNIRQLNEVDIQRGAANVALHQSEERFRSLIHVAPVGLLMVEAGGRITLANKTAESLFGYAPGQLIGKPMEMLLPERFRAQHPMFRQLFNTEERPRLSITGRNLFGLHQGGSEFPAEISLSPIETSEGSFTLASITDISERKQAEDEIRSLNVNLEQRVAKRTQQLEHERARWQGIVEGMADEVWSCNAEGKISLLNLGSATMMIGLEPFRNKSVDELFQEVETLYPNGQPRPSEETPLIRSLRGEIVRGEEIMRHHRTGITRYRQYSSAPTRNESGTITGAVAIVRDITEQKQAEEILHRYELLSANSKDIVLFIRADGLEILEANTAAVKSYGYSRDELLKLSLLDLCTPETHPQAKAQMMQADANGLLFETIHVCKDGSSFPAEISSQGATINDVRILISVVRDITDRKKAEKALHESEERFASAFYASPVGINIFRFSDGHSVDANDAFLSLTEYSREELIGHSAAELNLFINLEQRATWMREFDKQGAVRNLDIEIRKKSGEIANVLFSLAKIDLAGESMGLVMAIDITRRKRAEAALRQSEENFSKAFSSSPAALLITRLADGLMFELNEAYCKIVGYERDELLNHLSTDFDIFTLADRQAIVEQLQTHESVHDFETSIRHRSGAIRYVVVGHELITFNGEDCILSTLLDVTDRKQAEEAQRDSEGKLRAAIKSSNFVLAQFDSELRYQWIYNPHPDFDPSLVIGKRDDELDDTNGTKQLVKRKKWVIEKGQGIHEEISFDRSDGTHTYNFTIEPLFNADGSIVGATSAAIDITDRAQAEALLAYQAKLLSHVSEAVIGTNERMQITYWNASAKRIFGWTAEEAIGKVKTQLLRTQIQGSLQEETFTKLMEMGKFDSEVRYARKNGEFFIAHAITVVINGPKGDFKGLVTTIRDITKRKRVENALRASEERYRAVVENALDAILVTNPAKNGKVLSANPAACRLFGYSNEEFLKLDMEALIDMDDPNAAALLDQRKKYGHATMQLTYKRKNGERFLGELSTVFYQGKNGHRHAVAIIRDVTERKRTEEEVRKSQQLLQAIIDNTQAPIYVKDLEGRLIIANQSLGKVYGMSAQDLLGKTSRELIPGSPDTERHMANDQRVIETGQPLTFEELTPEHIFISLKFPLRDTQGRIFATGGVSTDITERKRTEEQLARLTGRLRLATYAARMGIWDWNIQKNELDWDEQMCALYGLKPGEFGGTLEAWLRRIHPEDRDSSKEIIQQALHGKGEFNIEFRVLWPDESVHWLKAHGQVFRNEDEIPLRMTGVSYEITELKQAETIARESEKRFSTAFHSSPVPQAITSQITSEILVVNDAFCRLFEYRREELIGQTITKLQMWEDSASHEAALEELRTTGHMRARETTARTRSGQIRSIIATIEPISWKGTLALISSEIDITARKLAEEHIAIALREKEVLLKEIHHRVKNNLQVISSLLRMQSTGVEDIHVRELFAESQRRVRAMALIHEQLYQSSDLAQINLRDYISSLVNYLRHSYIQRVSKVEISVDAEDTNVEMDRAMPLGLLISELVSNSLKYAFPTAADQQTGKIWVNARHEGKGSVLIVGDNGVGLPDELDIEHATSMGLQLVDSFVTQLRGQLTVQRKLGTVFTIFIPDKG